MPADLEGALDEVDDPVVGHARARVEAGLVPAVELEARLRNLEDQYRPRRMGDQVVAGTTGNDCHVRFRLRVVVERHGELAVDMPASPEGPAQGGDREADSRRVRRSLRLAHDEEAVDQLQALARLEEAQLRQPLVLDAPEPTGPDGRSRRKRHAPGQRIGRPMRRQRPETDSLGTRVTIAL